MTSRYWVPVLLIGLALSGSAGAQQGSAPLSVSAANGQFVVHIRQTGKLFPLLQELCRQTQAECEISASATSEALLVPMTITGSWNQVIGKMLEGTEFNFAATNATKAHDAVRLVIQNKPVGADPYVPAAASSNYAASAAPSMGESSSINTTPAESTTHDETGLPASPTAMSGSAANQGQGRSQGPAESMDIMAQMLSRAAAAGASAVTTSGPPLPVDSVDLSNPNVDRSGPPLPVDSVDLRNPNVDRSGPPLPVNSR